MQVVLDYKYISHELVFAFSVGWTRRIIISIDMDKIRPSQSHDALLAIGCVSATANRYIVTWNQLNNIDK